MLFDWFDRGVEVTLYSPQPNVMNMLWFRKFFHHMTGNTFLLVEDSEVETRPVVQPVSHREWEDVPTSEFNPDIAPPQRESHPSMAPRE